jgi:hypothetical protein
MSTVLLEGTDAPACIDHPSMIALRSEARSQIARALTCCTILVFASLCVSSVLYSHVPAGRFGQCRAGDKRADGSHSARSGRWHLCTAGEPRPAVSEPVSHAVRGFISRMTFHHPQRAYPGEQTPS